MTLATSDNRKNHDTDGISDTFAFNFKTYDSADITVYEDAVEVVAGITINLNADQVSSPGGEVVFDVAPADGGVITIYRELAPLQAVVYPIGGSFPSATHERALDEVYMIIQQLLDESSRAIKAAVSVDVGSSYILPNASAEKFIRWNAGGTDLENFDIADLGLYAVSPFMGGMLELLDDASVRSYLNAPSDSEVILQTLADAAGDLIYATAADTWGILPVGNPGQGPVVNAAGTALEHWAPKAYLSGLTLSNDAGDTDHDINIVSGEATNSAGNTILKLSAEITKQIDATFAVGDDAGGMATTTVKTGTFSTAGTAVTGVGSLFLTEFNVGDVLYSSSNAQSRRITAIASNLAMTLESAYAAPVVGDNVQKNGLALNTWYHLILIQKDSDKSIDVYFDTNPDAENIPAGYTAYRRIGSVLTDGSSNIYGFHMNAIGREAEVIWDVAKADIAVTNPGTSVVNRTLSTPLGVRTKAHLMMWGENSSASGQPCFYFSSLDKSAEGPTYGAGGTARLSLGPFLYSSGYPRYGSNTGYIWTDLNSQIRSQTDYSTASIAFSLSTIGYIDPRN